MTSQVSQAVLAELAPSGTLRVGLNYQNFLLVGKDGPDGQPRGIAPDLARELAKRLGVPISYTRYDAAGKLAEAVRAGEWDVAFLAIEPARANEIAFASAYLEIEATYLVPDGSPIRSIADVDQKGVRIAASAKSAYDLYLTRTLKNAELVRTQGIDASFKLFVDEKLDALSGLKPRLLTDAQKLPGARVLEGRFTAIQQSIGTPKGRDRAAEYLRAFAEDIKASGIVAQAIERFGVGGVSVAPMAPSA
ncbi:MAG: ABC transporter substrate-binding protein [Betaproteobacteria bacterium]|jgi:polar amino acid transport system substrate-binding protein|nr:ABC transporter substrate-binding protein [Betaproteobacteria bacterium]